MSEKFYLSFSLFPSPISQYPTSAKVYLSKFYNAPLAPVSRIFDVTLNEQDVCPFINIKIILCFFLVNVFGVYERIHGGDCKGTGRGYSRPYLSII